MSEPAYVDPLLQVLVGLVNTQPDAEIGITVNVAGALITGLLIHNQRWLDEVGVETAAAIKDPAVASSWMGIFTDWHEFLAKAVGLESLDDQPVGFIHLKGVTFVGTLQTARYWRGRLDSVVGWTFSV